MIIRIKRDHIIMIIKDTPLHSGGGISCGFNPQILKRSSQLHDGELHAGKIYVIREKNEALLTIVIMTLVTTNGRKPNRQNPQNLV